MMEVLVRRVYKSSNNYHENLLFFLVSPMDYGNISINLAFDTCETRHCTEIRIVDDTIEEMTESFFVTLETTPGLDDRITLNPVNGRVDILDNGTYIRLPDSVIMNVRGFLDSFTALCIYLPTPQSNQTFR